MWVGRSLRRGGLATRELLRVREEVLLDGNAEGAEVEVVRGGCYVADFARLEENIDAIGGRAVCSVVDVVVDDEVGGLIGADAVQFGDRCNALVNVGRGERLIAKFDAKQLTVHEPIAQRAQDGVGVVLPGLDSCEDIGVIKLAESV